MCGQTGIILGQKRRRAEERDHLAWLFTRLLVMSERRGAPRWPGSSVMAGTGSSSARCGPAGA